MREIIPAILPKSFEELRFQAEIVRHAVPFVQLDVCDGKFAESTTWPYLRSEDRDFLEILAESSGLPEWETLSYELDLMTFNPFEEAKRWIRAGVSRIIVHAESSPNIESDLDKIKTELSLEGSLLQVGVGLAISLETPIKVLERLLSYVSVVQVMGIKTVGFQGEPFDERAISRVSEIKSRYPEVLVSVDGGVGKENAPALLRAGADRLVIGSAIFKSANPLSEIEYFQSL